MLANFGIGTLGAEQVLATLQAAVQKESIFPRPLHHEGADPRTAAHPGAPRADLCDWHLLRRARGGGGADLGPPRRDRARRRVAEYLLRPSASDALGRPHVADHRIGISGGRDRGRCPDAAPPTLAPIP